MNASVYTIGYATKSFDTFMSQLNRHRVTAVVDVRSVPFSKVFHDYHQPALKTNLPKQNVHYIYMGDELGPRSKDQKHYSDKGQIQFDRLMTDGAFLSGINRILEGVRKGHKIALMCAEKHPLDCHRSLLIGFYLLRNKSVNLNHILHEGNVITQLELEKQMLDLHGLSEDLFLSVDQLTEKAWRCQCNEKNYIQPQK